MYFGREGGLQLLRAAQLEGDRLWGLAAQGAVDEGDVQLARRSGVEPQLHGELGGLLHLVKGVRDVGQQPAAQLEPLHVVVDESIHHRRDVPPVDRQVVEEAPDDAEEGLELAPSGVDVRIGLL